MPIGKMRGAIRGMWMNTVPRMGEQPEGNEGARDDAGASERQGSADSSREAWPREVVGRTKVRREAEKTRRLEREIGMMMTPPLWKDRLTDLKGERIRSTTSKGVWLDGSGPDLKTGREQGNAMCMDRSWEA